LHAPRMCSLCHGRGFPCPPHLHRTLFSIEFFCSLPATIAELTRIPSPEPTSVRTPSAALITVRGSKTCPTRSAASSAPANPTEITRAGFTFPNHRLGSAAPRLRLQFRRIRELLSPFSNSRYRRPPCSRVLTLVLTFQLRISGRTSRSIAAMMAVLDINARHIRCLGTSPPDRRNAPSTGTVRQPSSLSAFAELTNIILRPMRTASIVARGSRPRTGPLPSHRRLRPQTRTRKAVSGRRPQTRDRRPAGPESASA